MKLTNHPYSHAEYSSPACELISIEEIQSIIAASTNSIINGWEEDTEVIDLG